MGIYDKRVSFKPFEYDVMDFVDAMNRSFWIFTEFNFTQDINDYKTKTSERERTALKNCLLAISQIEVSVKPFWGHIYDIFPKPEFNCVGATFAESEVRHSRAYSHLLEILGFNDEFENLLKVPCISDRVEYLTKYLKYSKSEDKKKYTFTLTLFSLFIENVSLFSQFLIVKSFNKSKNLFPGIDNVIQATQKEEILHALLGAKLVNLIKEENSTWFDKEFYDSIKEACMKAYLAERNIIDWIFEKGELDFLPKRTVDNFIKDRFNQSLVMIGCEEIFEINKDLLKETKWFDIEAYSSTHSDFFAKRPTNYNKKSVSVTVEDLFD